MGKISSKLTKSSSSISSFKNEVEEIANAANAAELFKYVDGSGIIYQWPVYHDACHHNDKFLNPPEGDR